MMKRLAVASVNELTTEELRWLECHHDPRVAATAADELSERAVRRSKPTEKRPTPG